MASEYHYGMLHRFDGWKLIHHTEAFLSAIFDLSILISWKNDNASLDPPKKII